jgi:hypothetical protein
MCALNRFMSNLLAATGESSGHLVQVHIIEDNAQIMVSPTITSKNVSSTTSVSSYSTSCRDEDLFAVTTPQRIESLSPRFVIKLSVATNNSPTINIARKKSRSLHQENQPTPKPVGSPIVVSHSRIVSSSYKSRNKQLQKSSCAEALSDLGQSWSSVDSTNTQRRRRRRSWSRPTTFTTIV